MNSGYDLTDKNNVFAVEYIVYDDGKYVDREVHLNTQLRTAAATVAVAP